MRVRFGSTWAAWACAAWVCATAAPAAGQVAASASDGVLGMRVGMTLATARAEATRALASIPSLAGAEWVYEPRFMVDFSADCLTADGADVVCALVYEDPSYAPGATVEALVVLGSQIAVDGVTVGTAIVDAEARWGDAMFAFSWDNEGREFIAFDASPAGVSTRALSPSLGAESRGFHVGLYDPDKAGETYQETRVFRSDAVIGSIWLN